LFSKECISPKGYYSVRYAIMNRINRIWGELKCMNIQYIIKYINLNY
jgi:hypothetical protein